ncbi:MAG: hypothetical protein ABSB65_10475 [Candidatus Acidiferrales bacterium]|jgi:hypothetical protein
MWKSLAAQNDCPVAACDIIGNEPIVDCHGGMVITPRAKVVIVAGHRLT